MSARMSFDTFLKKIDVRYRLPRPTDALHLDSFQASIRIMRDVGEGAAIIVAGMISAVSLWAIANLIEASFETRLYFLFGMIIVILISLAEASSLVIPYYRISQRLTHGSARWADVATLRDLGLAHRIDAPLPSGALTLGRLTRKYDFVLPLDKTLRHIAMFGPPGSGNPRASL